MRSALCSMYCGARRRGWGQLVGAAGGGISWAAAACAPLPPGRRNGPDWFSGTASAWRTGPGPGPGLRLRPQPTFLACSLSWPRSSASRSLSVATLARLPAMTPSWRWCSGEARCASASR
jgi:hypothetical protein